MIESAAVVTGGGGRFIADAARESYDLFLTASPSEGESPDLEGAWHPLRSLRGHYATERIGIKALAALLAERFELEWQFVELPNRFR